MPESTRPESVVPVNFSNLALKQWLHFVGPIRRCKVLKKLKANLQNLGLSRRQVYRGLIQLATKPRVILTRQPSYRKYGSKKSLEENEDAGNVMYASCKTIVSLLDQHPQQRNEDAQRSNWRDRVSEVEGKHGENTERIKTCETARLNNIQVPVVPNRDSKLEDHPSTNLHSFDKALEHLDRVVSSKRNTQEKSSSKRTFSADSTSKSHHRHWLNNNDTATIKMSNKGGSHVNHGVEKNIQNTQKILDVVSDNVSSDMVQTSTQSKKNRIKSNLNSSSKKGHDCTKSETHKTVDTKLCNNEENTDVKVDSVSNKDKYFKHKSYRNVSAVTEISKVEESTCKRRLHETVTPDSSQRRKKIRVIADENKEIDKKKKNKIKKKFRIFFGDNISVSEDEQEVNLLHKRFKRRRKKDSVDSYDSGVCDTEKSAITNSIEILKDIQKAVPDSTMQEECNEDIVKETTTAVDILTDTKEITSNESINVDITSNESINTDITNNESINTDITNNESINTDIDKVESVKSVIQVESNELQSAIDNGPSKEQLSEEKLISVSDKNDTVESTVASNVIDTSTITEQPEVQSEQSISTAEVEAQIETNSTTLSCGTSEICSSTHDVLAEHENPPQFGEINLDTEGFDELLQMSFNDTCQIISNGNVLSIQETVDEELNQPVLTKEIDENSNVKVLPVVATEHQQASIATEDQHDKKKANHIEENNNVHLDDTQLLFDVEKNGSINGLWNAMDNVNKPTMENSRLNTATEKENTQSNKVSQGSRLRVLSSAELGSRWCPTPVNAVTSTTSQHLYPNILTMIETLVTESIPVTVSTITAPVSATIEITDNNLKKTNKDLKFSESVYVTLLQIYKLIKKLRTLPPMYKLNYDKHLFAEFEKLKKVVNTEDYIELTDGVVRIINREMFRNFPLSFTELFSYTPSLKSLCFRTTRKHPNVSVNNPSGYTNMLPVVTSSQIMLNQNINYNTQASQNPCVTSVQSKLKNLLSVPNMQNQASANISYKQPQQNISDEVVLQPQNNFFQSTMTMNSSASNTNNMQQQNYRIQTQETFISQKVPNTNSTKPKQMINMHTAQGFPLQHSSIPMNQLGGKHVPISVTNVPLINQQYAPQTVYIPQINTYYNANIPNYQIPKSLNPTHVNTQNVNVTPMNHQYQNRVYRQPACDIPKGIQVQNIQVPINYAPQPMQTMFAVHVPQSVPKNTEQNERIYKQIFPRVEDSTKVPPNLSEQMSHQNAPNTSSCKAKKSILLAKKKEKVQVSLESTTKLFNILKYLSDIQKILLLKQVNFYFNCTTWLAGQFTFQQWEKINKQRTLLLKFQTLLKHLVEKAIEGSLLNKSQTNTFETNILANINIDVPKSVQITVQETKEINCQLDTSEIDKEESKLIKNNSGNHQENLNNSLTQNQTNEEHQADSLLNKEHSDQVEESNVLAKEVQENKPSEDNTSINPCLENQTSDINIHQDNEMAIEIPISVDACNLNAKEQNLDKPEKTVEEKTLIESDLKLANEDSLHQSNTCSVIVQVSSKNDEVIVIDTTLVNEIKEQNEKLEEHEQLDEKKLQVTNTDACASLKDTTSEISVLSPKILEQNEQINDTEDTSIEESTVSHIADVRSISLEVFEKIAQCNTVPVHLIEGNIEEEEIKVCLYCGKPSTVACSICLEAKYCSKICFELHWQDHYNDCIPIENSVIYS